MGFDIANIYNEAKTSRLFRPDSRARFNHRYFLNRFCIINEYF